MNRRLFRGKMSRRGDMFAVSSTRRRAFLQRTLRGIGFFELAVYGVIWSSSCDSHQVSVPSFSRRHVGDACGSLRSYEARRSGSVGAVTGVWTC